jgi:hypothetical protein
LWKAVVLKGATLVLIRDIVDSGIEGWEESGRDPWRSRYERESGVVHEIDPTDKIDALDRRIR